MTRLQRAFVGILVIALTLPAAGGAMMVGQFDAVVTQILAEPYQPVYAPVGLDAAFAPDTVPNILPAQDYTSGSVPGSPDHPNWPTAFGQVTVTSGDGAPLLGRLALQPGTHPGIVVVHGFNTNGKESVIRWAAMLYANGYNVLALDQRDFKAEYDAGLGYPNWLQTFGWKESEDVLAAGRYLRAQPGVTSVGVVGFSEGGQNTVLALALDAQSQNPVFSAGLQFSGPADQNTQIYSTAVPPNCQTPMCTYPATQALVILVVPPYSQGNPCTVLGGAAAYYGTDAFSILARETAFHAQTLVKVPLLSFYSADDSLVAPFQATMMAGYERGVANRRTILIQRGEHAYFYDRWWQQRAILLYFKALLPGASNDPGIGTTPTVNQTAGGSPLSSQLVDLGSPTQDQADSYLAPFICDTTRGGPPTTTNYALAGNGATARPSSEHSSGRFPAVSAIDGDRTGNTWGNGGGWNDATRNAYLDVLEVDFPVAKIIDEINVFTLQNNWTTAGQPTLTTPATGEGILDFIVQTWNGSAWVTVPGGNVTGNDKAWKQFNFPAVTTTKIRVVVNNSRNNWSRIVEVEAFGASGQT